VAPTPACDPFIVDRYVAGARQAGIDALIVVNKLDLPSGSGELDFVGPLQAAGLPALHVSARTGTGLEALVRQLTGRRSLFAGQSGVGKSSLLNALAGEALRATGGLSAGSGEGRHTTVSSAILQAPWGEIADSPGVRDYAPPVVPARDVQRGYAEIEALAPGCRFRTACTCASHDAQCVRRRVRAIDPRRYESYRRLLNLNRQLEERRGWGP